MRFEMARRPKSRRVLSRGAKPFRRGERGEINSVADVVKSPEEIMRLILECQALLEPGQYDLEKAARLKMELDALILADQRANSPADVVKSPEEEIMRLVLECQALLEPGQYDPEKAARLKMELDALIRADQRAQQETDTEYFNWLEINIPELFKTQGRPTWIESEKVRSKDKALLDSFEQKKLKAAADVGKKHGVSKRAYGLLADESGDEDIETAKRRVMRARRRQKSLQKAIQDILGIAALAKTDGDKAIPPKEYERRRKKLLKAFRSVQRMK
jgi:hypothetical protein